jgi:glycolate oxidase
MKNQNVDKILAKLANLDWITDTEVLTSFGSDESGLGCYLPDAAIRVNSAQEIVSILKLANEFYVPVTPRGAGTGMTGGALPINGGIVISMEKLNQIIHVDKQNLIARVQPGIITGKFQSEMESLGLFYPPDPASLETCSLGGNVAENAGGPRALKYGVTREYVLGLNVVLPTGQVINTGRQTVKGVSGYDLTALIVGSEGTLAIVNEIIVKLRPNPPKIETILLFFPDSISATQAVAAIIGQGIIPRTLELMDKASIDAVRPKAEIPIPASIQAALLIELDGLADDDLMPQLERIVDIAQHAGSFEEMVAQGEKQRRQLWTARRLISDSLKELGIKLSEDIVVPRSKLPLMILKFQAICEHYNLKGAAFGHAGDGNLHLNIILPDENSRPIGEEALKEVFINTLNFGGTLSGEHGIGLKKQKYMRLEFEEVQLQLQKKLKLQFDPNNILNPGKIFPADI